ncbi:MAG: hypothetical protein IJX38_01260 [Clostridia bacterium]|nr:hypothetical protein [Clostridia bacterium]
MVVMRNNAAHVELTSAAAGTEKVIPWKDGDSKMVLVIVASAATTVTVKAGNGIQGTNDRVLDISEGVNLVKLESGRFKNVTGINKGNIVVVPAATVELGVAVLV